MKDKEITFKQWKKVQDGEKYRHKEVQEVREKAVYITEFESELDQFEEHVGRVKHQYEELRKRRENIPKGDVVVWMDLAENYMCSSFEEVQSAYWNTSMVTLHTMVVYFRSEGIDRVQSDAKDKSVQCFVAVSDVLNHNAVSVDTILKQLISEIKMLVPDIRRIHYLTDSPTSQHRNKSIFRLISTHEEEFGVQARWNYLESGHGKGPCDGLGASVKRSAEPVIKHGKVSIQNASYFFSYAQKTMEEGSKVKYIYYTQEDYDEAKSTLDAKTPIQAVQGTFKIQYVVAINPMQIYTRNVSCYCQQCIDDVAQSNCEGYTNHFLTMREKKKNKDQIDHNQQNKSKENENALEEMEHISENVDDNDKQQPLERNRKFFSFYRNQLQT